MSAPRGGDPRAPRGGRDASAPHRGAVAALLPAAGAGTRLGRGPKAFVRVGRRSLLGHAAAAFAGLADELVVAAPPGLERQAARHAPGATVVTGGATRQATVRRLLAAARAEIVLVHDAARPFLPRSVTRGVIEAARASGAATAAVRVPDTLVEADGGAGVDRERLRAVQTPQGFRRELLREAHERAASSGLEATDDAALVRALGHEVALVEGSRWLFKVTTSDDLELARALAGAFRRG